MFIAELYNMLHPLVFRDTLMPQVEKLKVKLGFDIEQTQFLFCKHMKAKAFIYIGYVKLVWPFCAYITEHHLLLVFCDELFKN